MASDLFDALVDGEPKKNEESIDIGKEMEGSYLAYSLSVITSRAIPDVRDGLKPVHRRILYAMHDEGLTHNKKYSKSAGVVGEVLKKYHPHGDGSVYGAMVRLVQPWKMRHPLIDGQGNWGSSDGDSAAAYRYTEARLTQLSSEFVADIDKDVIPWRPNFDGTRQEPEVLPVKFPNLLVNGTDGIAVGMGTFIPTHNLKEVINGTLHLLHDPLCSIEALVAHIPGPDFPTGGILCGNDGAIEAFKTGHGKAVIRAKTRFEEVNKRQCILVDEVPYDCNKERLITKIAELVRDKKIEGIADANDDSDRNGISVRITLKKGADPNLTLNQLWKMTELESSYSYNMLAVCDGRPVTFNLKRMLEEFIKHRKNVVTRRSRFDLKNAEARKHVVEGLIKAQEHIDEIIKIIRSFDEIAEAKQDLMSKYQLSEIQANAIVEMRLRQLVGLEKKKLEDELSTLKKDIEYFSSVINDEKVLIKVINDELVELRDKYGNDRRTKIEGATQSLDTADLIKNEQVVVTVTHKGYVRRCSLTQYREQNRGGKGKSGGTTGDGDFISDLFIANTHDYILVFTDKGKCYWLKVWDLPDLGVTAKGRSIINFIKVEAEEKVQAILPVKDFKVDVTLFFCTAKGVVKRTGLEEFGNPRAAGIRAITLDSDDHLVDVKQSMEKDEVLIGTADGMVARYPVSLVRAMGRGAAGVRGISLGYKDSVVGVEIVSKEDPGALLSVTTNGYGKRSDLNDFRSTGRAVKGVRGLRVTEKNGNVVGLMKLRDDQGLMLITNKGQCLRCSGEDINVKGRATQGVRLLRVGGDEQVAAIARIALESESL